MTATSRPRVFLVDDHELFRAGVRAELGDSVDVVGEADDVIPAIELITERLPDVVLLDVHLPDGGGQLVVERAVADDHALDWHAVCCLNVGFEATDGSDERLVIVSAESSIE